MKNKTPLNSDLEARLEIVFRRAATAANFAAANQTTFVFRPGDPNPAQNVYTTWASLYAPFSLVQGPKTIQFDNTFAPLSIPAGNYDLRNAALVGTRNLVIPTTVCTLDDGVVFTNLNLITDLLTLVSRSTSVPVYTFTDSDFLLIQNASSVANDPLSTVPFFRVPAGLAINPFITLDLGGGIGNTGGGIHTVQVDAGASLQITLNDFASLQSDVLVGPGSVQAVVGTQSAFAQTPFPFFQPAIGTFSFFIFDFAGHVSFQGLNPTFWVPPPPDNVEQAINRLANQVFVLGGPIP